MPEEANDRMKKTTLAAFLVIAITHALPAQAQLPASASGFNDIPWGVSASELESQLGPAAHSEQLELGITVYAYRDSVAGAPSVAMYAVLDSLGMVKGQHAVTLDPDQSCDDQYTKLRDYVKLTYPLLTPVENQDVQSWDDFCTAYEKGEASWATQWRDPETGTVMTVLLEPEAPVIKVIFESAEFIAWLHARQDGTQN